MKAANSVLVIAASMLLVSGVVFVSSISTPASALRGVRATAHKNVFFLGITITFVDAKSKAEFIELFTPYARFVAANEPTTISYELCQSDKNELQLFVNERYVSKDAYLNIHRKTNEFQVFREKLAQMSDVSCFIIFLNYLLTLSVIRNTSLRGKAIMK